MKNQKFNSNKNESVPLDSNKLTNVEFSDKTKNSYGYSTNRKQSINVPKNLKKFSNFSSQNNLSKNNEDMNSSPVSMHFPHSDDEKLKKTYVYDNNDVLQKPTIVQKKYYHQSDEDESSYFEQKYLKKKKMISDKLSKRSMRGRSYSSSMINKDDSDSSSSNNLHNSSPIKKSRSKKDRSNLINQISDVEVGSIITVKYGRGKTIKLYEAKVTQINNDGKNLVYLVHYKGWNTRYDEWISADRISINGASPTIERGGSFNENKTNSKEDISIKTSQQDIVKMLQDNSFSTETDNEATNSTNNSTINSTTRKSKNKSDDSYIKQNNRSENINNNLPLVSKRMTRNSLQDFMLSTALVESIKGINTPSNPSTSTSNISSSYVNNKEPRSNTNGVPSNNLDNKSNDSKHDNTSEFSSYSTKQSSPYSSNSREKTLNKDNNLIRDIKIEEQPNNSTINKSTVTDKIKISTTADNISIETMEYTSLQTDPIEYLENCANFDETHELFVLQILEDIVQKKTQMKKQYKLLEHCITMIDKRLKSLSNEKRSKRRYKSFQQKTSDNSSEEIDNQNISKKNQTYINNKKI